MYKTESTLGLVGSILSAVLTFFALAGALISVFFYSLFEQVLHTVYNNWVAVHVVPYGISYEMIISFIPIIAICAAAAISVAAASFILGFVGTAKLNRGDRSGGVLLIVGGALALVSFVGFIPFVLMLVGGIMAISKKPAAASQPVTGSAS